MVHTHTHVRTLFREAFLQSRLTVFLLVFFHSMLFSQYCGTNTIPGSTIDVFDWTTESFSVWMLDDGQLITEIPSPFYPSPQNLVQLNTSYLWGVTSGEPKDFLPEEGWELLYYNFGSPEAPIDIPSLALYHRPSGKIRLLVYVIDIAGVDYSELYLRNAQDVSAPYVSAVLEHAVLPTHSIEGYTDRKIEVSTPNKVWDLSIGGDTEGIWMVLEMPAFYDPCVCQYSSGLEFGLFVANTTDFTIVLEGDGQIEQVFPSSSATADNSTLKGIYKRAKLLGQGFTKGVVAHKNVNYFLGQLENLLVLRANSNLGQLSTSQLQELGSLLGLSGAPQSLTNAQLNTLYQLAQDGSSGSGAAGLLERLLPGALNTLLMPEWVRAQIPFAGAAIAFLDFLVGGGKSASTPKPMQFDASFQFVGSGELYDSTFVRQYAFKTPGAAIGVEDIPEPVYDNPLGVLSIVNDIKITHEHIWWDDEDGAIYYDSYQLTNPLQYAVNPASGLHTMPEEIRAALRIIVHHPIDDFPPPNIFPVWVPETGLIQIDDTTYRTPYLPLSCLPAYKVRLLDYVEGGVLEDRLEPKVYLHLVARFEQENAQPGDKDAFFSQLYRVNLVNTPASVEEDVSLLFIPENLTVATIEQYMAQNPVAWNGVTIEGDVTLTEENFFIVNELFPPDVVTIITSSGIGYQIHVSRYDFEPGDVITGGFVLESLPDCYEPQGPMTTAELASFCSNTDKYHPLNILGFARREESLESSETYQKGNSGKLFPNPSKGMFTLEFYLSADTEVSVRIMNPLSNEDHLILEKMLLSKGHHSIAVDAQKMAQGTYFVSLEIAGEPEARVFKWVKL